MAKFGQKVKWNTLKGPALGFLLDTPTDEYQSEVEVFVIAPRAVAGSVTGLTEGANLRVGHRGDDAGAWSPC